jgi:hypothetical protein
MRKLTFVVSLAICAIATSHAQAPVDTVTLRATQYRVENNKVIVTLASGTEVVFNAGDVLQPAVRTQSRPTSSLKMSDQIMLPTPDAVSMAIATRCAKEFPDAKRRETCQSENRRSLYDLWGRTTQINTVQRVAVRNGCAEEAAGDYVQQNECEAAEIPPGPSPARASTATSSSPSPAAVSSRCQATTKAGAQCKRNAQPGRAYCWQH